MNVRAAAYLAAGAAALGLIFLLLRPAAPPLAVVATPAAALAPAAPRIFEIEVRNGAPVAAPAAMRVRQGDEVMLRVRSDRDDELHVHGYDLHLALRAGVPGELRFSADRSGRFDCELHHAGASLGALEVEPRQGG